MNPVVFSGLLLGVSAGFLVAIWGLSPPARSVPLLVSVPTVALACYQLLREAVLRPAGGSNNRSELRAIVWLLALPAAVYGFGFLFAVPVYLMGHARLAAGESWRYSIALGAISLLLIWSLQNLLEVQTYGGQLWNMLP